MAGKPNGSLQSFAVIVRSFEEANWTNGFCENLFYRLPRFRSAFYVIHRGCIAPVLPNVAAKQPRYHIQRLTADITEKSDLLMETIQSNLYDHPQYYDLVFGSDWKAEFDFLLACFEKHITGRVQRLFEPACGTGRLLYRLAMADYEVSGIDLNEKAVQYCNDRLQRHGFPATAFVGDMTNFHLPQPVDAGFNTINSFRHLREESQAEAHFECMGKAIRKGGIYILGLHLTPSQGSPFDEESWSARRGHLCVNTHMWTVACDLENRQEAFRMTYDVYTPTKQFRLEDEIHFRTYTVEQFEDLVERTGIFEIDECYDFGYDVEDPIDLDAETQDVVFILRRK